MDGVAAFCKRPDLNATKPHTFGKRQLDGHSILSDRPMSGCATGVGQDKRWAAKPIFGMGVCPVDQASFCRPRFVLKIQKDIGKIKKAVK